VIAGPGAGLTNQTPLSHGSGSPVVLIEGVSIEQEFQTETACKGNTWIQFLKQNIRSDPGPQIWSHPSAQTDSGSGVSFVTLNSDVEHSERRVRTRN